MDEKRLAVFRPALADGIFALVMAAYAAYDVLAAKSWPGPWAVNAAVVATMTLALALRRTLPLLVLAIVGSSLVTLGALYGSAQAWSSLFPFVVAAYSAAAYSRRTWAVGLVVAVTAVLRDYYDPYVHTIGDAMFSSTLATLTVLAGIEGRRIQLHTDRVDRRAEVLAREEDELAMAAAMGERRRIARELHDILSHGLGAMVLQAGAAEQIVEADPVKAKEVLASIRSTGIDSIGELGALLSLVREGADPSLEPQPTIADLPALIDRARVGGMDVDLRLELGDARLSQALELSVFRIVQEGLTNASKHASGAHVIVAVIANGQRLDVSILDDGSDTTDRGGTRKGLAGMGERVAVFGGRLFAGHREVGGWAVEASMPIPR